MVPLGKRQGLMAKHTWTYPYYTEDYRNMLAEGAAEPRFELVRELDVGRGSFCGSGHAWIVEDVANGIVCLQSYSTIVSVVRNGQAFHLGKWTRATSGHQSKFSALSTYKLMGGIYPYGSGFLRRFCLSDCCTVPDDARPASSRWPPPGRDGGHPGA